MLDEVIDWRTWLDEPYGGPAKRLMSRRWREEQVVLWRDDALSAQENEWVHRVISETLHFFRFYCAERWNHRWQAVDKNDSRYFKGHLEPPSSVREAK